MRQKKLSLLSRFERILFFLRPLLSVLHLQHFIPPPPNSSSFNVHLYICFVYFFFVPPSRTTWILFERSCSRLWLSQFLKPRERMIYRDRDWPTFIELLGEGSRYVAGLANESRSSAPSCRRHQRRLGAPPSQPAACNPYSLLFFPTSSVNIKTNVSFNYWVREGGGGGGGGGGGRSFSERLLTRDDGMEGGGDFMNKSGIPPEEVKRCREKGWEIREEFQGRNRGTGTWEGDKNNLRFNKWYRVALIILSLRVSNYLRRVERDKSLVGVAKFRMGNKLGEYGICEREEESWEHMLGRCEDIFYSVDLNLSVSKSHKNTSYILYWQFLALIFQYEGSY